MTFEISSPPDENLQSRLSTIVLILSTVIGYKYIEWLTSSILGKGTSLIFCFNFGPTLVKNVLKSSRMSALLGSVQRALHVFNAYTCELFRVVPLISLSNLYVRLESPIHDSKFWSQNLFLAF